MSTKNYEWYKLTRGMTLLMRDEKITMSELNLFMLIIENTNSKSGVCYMGQVDMVELLGKKKQVISRNLLKLVNMNLIGKTKRGYIANPTAVFVGDAESQRIAMGRYTSAFGTTVFTEKTGVDNE